MNSDQLDAALQAYCGRRPFRAFLIELTSGAQVAVKHPEVVGRRGIVYALRVPDGGFTVFAAESVARLLNVPTTPPAE